MSNGRKSAKVSAKTRLKPGKSIQATGLYATAEEVDEWLASWGTDNELPAPECHE